MSGHAVRALYLAAGVVDVYLETGDRSLLEAVVRQWDSAISAKTYITGGQGSRPYDEAFGDPYELPPDSAYAETCAGIASIMLAWRLLLATGRAGYADQIERTLFNLVAAATSLNGVRFFYVNPLQRRSPSPTEQSTTGAVQRHGAGHSGARAAWFDCACCPPNLLRLLASVQTYVATTHAGGGQLHQYTSSHVDAVLPAGRRIALRMDTDYPWSGHITITITITRAEGAPWSLALRVPEWSRRTALTVCGEPRPADVDERGYVVVTRPWRTGDVVILELDMAPRTVEPHPRIDAVRGCLAFERGPLVYCLEQVDQQTSVELADATVSADVPPRAIHRADLLGGTTVLELDGAVGLPVKWEGRAYRPRTVEAGDYRPTKLVAVPYHQWANRRIAAMRVWVPCTSL